jgi:predicted AAA+ superfamily ATPase
LKQAIISHNKHWKQKYENLFYRDVVEKLTKKINLKQIQILTGIRRSGKSSIFKILINYLIDNDIDPFTILYINLDDPFFGEIWQDSKKLYDLITVSESITGKKIEYLFLDEIQNVNNWEKFIKVSYDNESFKKIFITGSNAKLLEGEFASLISGRYLKEIIYPLNFKEVLRLNNINSYLDLLNNKAKVLSIIEKIMEYGSFFEVLKEKEFKRDILLSYLESIIYKDCILTNNIRDVKFFKNFVQFILSNTSNLYSYNSLAKALNSNENTVKTYLSFLQEAFLIYEINNFSFSLKKQIKSKKKSYAIDNGLVAQISFRFTQEKGKLFENMVFSELKKRNYEIYFYNEKYECDFLIKNDKLKAVQVAYELNDFNFEREVRSLINLPFEAEKFIITFNQEKTYKDIKIIPFYEFFK